MHKNITCKNMAENVLIIDDDPIVRRLISDSLDSRFSSENIEASVLTTKTMEGGLALLDGMALIHRPISTVVVDLRVNEGKMDGDAFSVLAKECHPGIKTILFTSDDEEFLPYLIKHFKFDFGFAKSDEKSLERMIDTVIQISHERLIVWYSPQRQYPKDL